MRREIAAAVVAIQVALASTAAQAAYNQDQLNELNELLDEGNITKLIHFWNRNITSFSRNSRTEVMLAELMADIRENGIGSIGSDLRDAAERAAAGSHSIY